MKIKDISSINFLDWYIKKEYWYAGDAYFVTAGHKKSEFVCSTTSELYEIFLQDLKN